MSPEPGKPVSLAEQMQSNRTCLLVSMAVMAMLFFACLVMGFLALYR
jgi:hypothetical protein